MKSFPPTKTPSAEKSHRRIAARARGFTLAEVLAALMLMAIVVLVGMEAMSVAARAGTLGNRKAEAAQVAESVLAENIVTGAVTGASSSGSVTRNGLEYPWTLRAENWSVDSMTLVTVEVRFEVQGRSYTITVSSLQPKTSSV